MAMVDAGKNMMGIIPEDVNGGNWIAFSAGTRIGMTARLARSTVYVFANKYAVCRASAEPKRLQSANQIVGIAILPLAKSQAGSAIFTNHDGIIPEDLLLSRHACDVFWPTAMMLY